MSQAQSRQTRAPTNPPSQVSASGKRVRLLTCPHAPISGRALFLGVFGVWPARETALALKPAGDLARAGFRRQVDSPLGLPPTPTLTPKLPPRGSKERLQVPEMGGEQALYEGESTRIQTRGRITAWVCTGCVTMGKSLNLSGPHFRICKMGSSAVPGYPAMR